MTNRMQGTSVVEDLQKELDSIKCDLDTVTRKIRVLDKERQALQKKYSETETKLRTAQVRELSTGSNSSPYDRADGFPWSFEVLRVQRELFHLSAFRPLQLRAINATLDGKDVILVMPTGAGKSLVYQLPALLDHSRFRSGQNTNPVTLVISPLVSLMTDQTMNLTRSGIPEGMVKVFDANTPLTEQKEILDSLVGKSTKKSISLRLLYVTPEKLAKSKRLLNRLEAAYSKGLLGRIAIDEVHCLSQWGHDFRPDYQFLHVLRRQFPTVPILGITATASGNVIVDVQSMLGLQPDKCLVVRSCYNRKNLYYEVRTTCGPPKSAVQQLYLLIQNRYCGQSGIIYCFSQKDTEDVAGELRRMGLRVAHYHANMDGNARARVHTDWFTGKILIIVATVAFGMGIDKPDVRFVLHFSASKSLENYYQESGRAGRDSEAAECVVLWRFSDFFRLASMVSSERTGLSKLLQIVAYCLDPVTCRRLLISKHLDDPTWSASDCAESCDNCRRAKSKDKVLSLNLTQLISEIKALLSEHMSRKKERITGPKLVELMSANSDVQRLTRAMLKIDEKTDRMFFEHVIAWCLVNQFLKMEFHFTPYSTVCYVVPGKEDINDAVMSYVIRNHEPNTRTQVDAEKEPLVKRQRLTSHPIIDIESDMNDIVK
ncbi:putative ATP-dependent DNA helicase Q1, variant 2 [Clonorchis sinensis]|uniref:ATP-dependent DNA helicase n=3 Tax=Clonorchis sinensis TaxID=79923 RepID=A0A8T1MN73_CLOSI|nr:putative ATP-dependent DNA helicase Q1, variant 2 [Clonorchis sinensis]